MALETEKGELYALILIAQIDRQVQSELGTLNLVIRSFFAHLQSDPLSELCFKPLNI